MILIEEIKSIEDLEKEYYDYLENHIMSVQRSWSEILRPAIEGQLTDEEVERVEDAVKLHDASKYMKDTEFDAYRKWWYPVDESEKDEKAYDLAWLYHQKNNKHHPQYWILIRDSGSHQCLDMPIEYIIEMLCDWHSFSSRDPESTAYNWYQENKGKMQISDSTREVVEKYIGFLKEPLK